MSILLNVFKLQKSECTQLCMRMHAHHVQSPKEDILIIPPLLILWRGTAHGGILIRSVIAQIPLHICSDMQAT